MQFYDRNDISMLKGLFWKLLSVRLTIMSVTRSAYLTLTNNLFLLYKNKKMTCMKLLGILQIY